MILWGAAFQECTDLKRIHLWADNVRVARAAVRNGTVLLDGKIGSDAALMAAVQAARKIGIRTRRTSIDQAIDATIAIGTGILTSFVLPKFRVNQ